METVYRPAFLRDLKKLKKQKSIYDRVYALVFETLPEAESLNDLTGVKAMSGYPGSFRIRLGQYRVGVEYDGERLDVMRVLHRREFYRYFPE